MNLDGLGRKVDYLRLSITDRCNERCLYCLPEKFADWTPREEILSYAEILEVVRISVSLGFKHFRVTGGEPLLREGVVDFVRELHQIPGVETVQMTTNGTRLPLLAEGLFSAGLRKLNISLDALDPVKYRHITHGDLGPVLKGIERAKQLGFPSIKLNTVLMRGKNEDQILPLVRFAAEHDLVIRFIELMPVSLTEMLDESNFLPVAEVKRLLENEDRLDVIGEKLGFGPARYFRMERLAVTVGLIGALTDLHFCDSCNKMRLTADGKIRPCLGNHGELDLKPALRPQLQPAEIRKTFAAAFGEKPPEHLFRDNYQPQRIMTAIGANRMSYQITVFAFAQVRELFGFSEKEVLISSEMTPRQIILELQPNFDPQVHGVRVAVDCEYHPWDQPVGQIKELAAIPPVSGG